MSEQIQILKLPTERWQEWKELRERSLREEPQAFWEKLENFLIEPDEKFMQQIHVANEEKKSWRYFAQINGHLVGTVTAAISQSEPRTAGMSDVYVDKDARGRGIAKMLMETLLSRLKVNQEIEKISLHVNKEAVGAVNLYTHFGFQTVDEESVLLGDGKWHDVLVMELINGL